MKRDDWMLLSLTFLTGLAIGMYVYITAFKPTYEAESLSDTEAEAGEWSVVGKRVGGDDEDSYIQPSFRLLGNGEYTYLPGGSGNTSLEQRSGSLAAREMSPLSFTEAELAAFEQSGRLPVCASNRGGYDYEYRVTFKQNSFLFDTCSAAFSDSSLEASLADVWQSIEGTRETRRYNNISDWLESFLRGYFVVEERDQ